MRNALVYVHYEPLAHLYLTAGISASDLLVASQPPMRHLLLLPPVDETDFIDPHTGFNEISGAEAVSSFLQSKEARDRSWLDYQHGAYLRELTPTEIAELLYLGHAKTHIQVPFYYKLQNNLVYLPNRNQMVTLYVRHQVTFDKALAAAIDRHLRWAANDQPFWLRLRQQQLTPVPAKITHQLTHLLEEGVVFDFGHAVFSRDTVQLPLLTLTSRYTTDTVVDADHSHQVGQLSLDRAVEAWSLDTEMRNN